MLRMSQRGKIGEQRHQWCASEPRGTATVILERFDWFIEHLLILGVGVGCGSVLLIFAWGGGDVPLGL